jgi:hypothetical protein
MTGPSFGSGGGTGAPEAGYAPTGFSTAGFSIFSMASFSMAGGHVREEA